MIEEYEQKSTISEIRERFDQDVERFSNLDTGQATTIDAPLSLELITGAAKAVNPTAKTLLDIGCGAGNYTLKMLEKIPDLDCNLVDLSHLMLERAKERVKGVTKGKVKIFQNDIRDFEISEEHYDIMLAGAVLHHLRTEADWAFVFEKLFKGLKKGGSLWISDLVIHDCAATHKFIWDQYGRYLENMGGLEFREKVFAYINKEDSPRSVNFQMDLMKKVGFKRVEILHKNLCFAAFGGVKGR